VGPAEGRFFSIIENLGKNLQTIVEGRANGDITPTKGALYLVVDYSVMEMTILYGERGVQAIKQ